VPPYVAVSGSLETAFGYLSRHCLGYGFSVGVSLAFIPFLQGDTGGAPAVPSKVIFMQSILEILLVTVKSGTAKKSGQPYAISEAHCVLRNPDGSPGAVGVLVVPKSLESVAVPGMFTASFGLIAATYGEQQGRIVAQLAGLIPVPSGAMKTSPKPA
jgi:hypothetical protein